jgi:hypothetical protein
MSNLANSMNFITATTIPEFIACIYQIADNIRLLNQTTIDVGPVGILLAIPESLRSIALIPSLKQTGFDHFFENDFVSVTFYPLGLPPKE